MKKLKINFLKKLLIITFTVTLIALYSSETQKKNPIKSTALESDIFCPISPIDINASPILDGNSDDSAWAGIPGYILTIHQNSKKIKIVVKTLKTKSRIFFLIKAPLKSFIKQHKLWHWDKQKQIYTPGDEKETSLKLLFYKEFDKNAKLANPNDIWIWRAARNNIAGFADDMYLKEGLFTMDKGRSCWFSRFFGEFAGATLPRFYQRTPKGSASDVKAKGIFNKTLTVEFSRKLNTENRDDIDLNNKFFIKLILE